MTYALIALLCVYLLWVHYVAVMRLMQVRDAGYLTPRNEGNRLPGARCRIAAGLDRQYRCKIICKKRNTRTKLLSKLLQNGLIPCKMM